MRFVNMFQKNLFVIKEIYDQRNSSSGQNLFIYRNRTLEHWASSQLRRMTYIGDLNELNFC